MRPSRLVLPGVCCVALAVVGCLPDDLPSYVDERTVVLVAESNSLPAIYRVDVKDRTVTTRPLGPSAAQTWEGGTRMIGGLIFGERGYYDPAKDQIVPLPFPGDLNLERGLIPASIEGRRSLLVREKEAGAGKYGVYSFPDFKKQKNLHLENVLPCGGFWWAEFEWKEANQERSVAKVQVHDANGSLVCTIAGDEVAKAGLASLRYARVNSKDNVLLLVRSYQGFSTFGIFDLANGKFLWGGRNLEEGATGHPVVKRDEVWYLETKYVRVKDPNTEQRSYDPVATLVVRYRSGGKATTQPVREAAELPYNQIRKFNLSPDETQFLTVSEEPTRKLLIIPIRLNVTAKDVVSIDLEPAPARK